MTPRLARSLSRRERLVEFALVLTTACGPNTELPGKSVAESEGCFSCHSVDGSVRAGPTWAGLYLSEVELSDGSKVTADEAYLRESITDPSARTVAGFRKGLMETVVRPGSLTEEEMTALIEYLKALK